VVVADAFRQGGDLVGVEVVDLHGDARPPEARDQFGGLLDGLGPVV